MAGGSRGVAVDMHAHLSCAGPYRYTGDLYRLQSAQPREPSTVPKGIAHISSQLATHLLAWRDGLKDHPDTGFHSLCCRRHPARFLSGLRSLTLSLPSPGHYAVGHGTPSSYR